MKKGFTIIEVSLVLAIAGLIFLMVFVALPALQRSQRDTQRREDMLMFVNEVKKYEKNNRGALPGGSETSPETIEVIWNNEAAESAGATTWLGFYKNYLGGEEFMDPDGENYRIKIVNCNNNLNESCGVDVGEFPNDYKIILVKQSRCNDEQPVAVSNPRKISVVYKLEGGGIYCNNT